MKRKKHLDVIGICCGVFLVLALIFNIVMGNATKPVVEMPEGSENALTLTGSAQGRNGEVSVEVLATPEQIFQIKVTNHTETDGIGSVAVEELPSSIVDSQSLLVDSISGATVTSDAIKEAVRAALLAGGIDAAPFENAAAMAELPAEDMLYDVDVVVLGAGGAGRFPVFFFMIN